jgi:CBS domain-containing protein
MRQSISAVMSRNPIVVQPTTPIGEAIQLLATKRISALPVVNEQGHLVGIVAESDLMWRETGVTPPPYVMLLDSVIYLQAPMKFERSLHKALGQTVADVMSPHPTTITSEESLPAAAKLMNERQVHSLPVLNDDHQLVGILTRGDIIRLMAAELQAVPATV